MTFAGGEALARWLWRSWLTAYANEDDVIGSKRLQKEESTAVGGTLTTAWHRNHCERRRSYRERHGSGPERSCLLSPEKRREQGAEWGGENGDDCNWTAIKKIPTKFFLKHHDKPGKRKENKFSSLELGIDDRFFIFKPNDVLVLPSWLSLLYPSGNQIQPWNKEMQTL